jgi:mercuric reductase
MTTTAEYDLVILGGGAAAFAAATEASRRDLSTAIVNAGLPIGGTCVNVGCVPTKHLLEVGKTAFEPPRNPFEAVQYGEDEPTVDWETAVEEMTDLVDQLREENYVNVADHLGTDIYEGVGRFVDDATNEGVDRRVVEPTVEIVGGADEGSLLAGEKVLVATGSSPWAPPIDGLDAVEYETSESILQRTDLPGSIVILGGGYVALEWGQILHHAGVDVTILQRSGRVLSDMEGQVGRELQRCFREEGIEVVTGNDFQRARATESVTDGGVRAVEKGVAVETIVDGEERAFVGETLFVATGVRPNTDGVSLDSIGVETDARDAIVVDEQFRTTNPDVYAAGNVVGDPYLETVAAKEGNHAVQNAFDGEGKTIDYDAVPKVVYTSPEVAAVGTTELEYMDEHGTCSCRTVDMADVPKARAVGDTRGLLQVVKHHETDEIVGVHMVGPRAADMIPQATLAVKYGLTIDDVIDTIHPFPTFSEAFKHACQAFRRDTETMSCCVV